MPCTQNHDAGCDNGRLNSRVTATAQREIAFNRRHACRSRMCRTAKRSMSFGGEHYDLIGRNAQLDVNYCQHEMVINCSDNMHLRLDSNALLTRGMPEALPCPLNDIICWLL